MSEPFLGEIIMFGGDFAPRGWALCDGQLLQISQFSALFSILGTTYGGDGRTTFGLPDLRGRAPIHAGQGPGLSDRPLGSKNGTETNTLSVGQLPAHNHPATLKAVSDDGNVQAPANANFADDTRGNPYRQGGTLVDMASNSIAGGNTGGGQSVNNMQPYQTVNFIIALLGTFPSRN